MYAFRKKWIPHEMAAVPGPVHNFIVSEGLILIIVLLRRSVMDSDVGRGHLWSRTFIYIHTHTTNYALSSYCDHQFCCSFCLIFFLFCFPFCSFNYTSWFFFLLPVSLICSFACLSDLFTCGVWGSGEGMRDIRKLSVLSYDCKITYRCWFMVRS